MAIFLSLLTVHFVLFVAAVVLTLLSKAADRPHKAWQILFSLLVPFVGPGLTSMVHIGDRLKPQVNDRYMGQTIDECDYHPKSYR